MFISMFRICGFSESSVLDYMGDVSTGGVSTGGPHSASYISVLVYHTLYSNALPLLIF